VSNVITDAELVSQFAKKAMEEPEAVITSRAPSETSVDLPGGYIKNSTVIKTAEVRELNGADEEAIAKAGSRAKALHVLLQRGLVKLGADEVTKEDLDNLLSGDRDAILLGTRKVTFGEEMPLNVRCFTCNEDQEVVLNLTEDVPVVKLEDPIEGRAWFVNTKNGQVGVALPTGLVQKKLMDNADKTAAEINTLLLSGCVLSVNGVPSMGAHTVLSLGMIDRSKIVDEIIEKNPGPRLGEVSKACKACGEDISLPLSLLDLFRL
jgi:hypothetical protein